MSGTDVAPSTVFEQAMALAVRRMTGVSLGKIQAYDPVTQRATVTSLVPILVRKDPANSANDVVDPVITLTDVPVEWPCSHSAAGALQHSIKFPLPAGSWVSIEPKGHDHSQWLTSGAEGVTPTDDRRFSIADVVVRPLAPIPLATQPVDAQSYDAIWGVLFGKWSAGGPATATDFVALATITKAHLDSIQDAHDSHVHPTAPDGPTSVPDRIIGSLSGIASTDFKAK